MMGDVIQIRDYQSRKDLARMYSEPSTLELMAVDVFGMLPLPDFFNALHEDTSPSEMNPFVAPDGDCA